MVSDVFGDIDPGIKVKKLKKLLSIENDTGNSDFVEKESDVSVLASDDGVCDKFLVKDELIAQ